MSAYDPKQTLVGTRKRVHFGVWPYRLRSIVYRFRASTPADGANSFFPETIGLQYPYIGTA